MEQALEERVDEEQEGHLDFIQDEQEPLAVGVDDVEAMEEANGDEATASQDEDGDEEVEPPQKDAAGSSAKKSKGPDEDHHVPKGLPATTVKRIIRLDPDIRLVSKEGIFAIIQTTQLFLESLAAESLSQARKSKRKGVKADDLLVVSKNNTKFRDCFGNSLADFLRSLDEEDESEGRSEVEGEGEDEVQEDASEDPKKNKAGQLKRKKLAVAPPNNRSVTEFFLRKVVEETTESELVDDD